MTGQRLPAMSDCRDCADPIRFVKLGNGSIIPVNPRPDAEHGNVVAHLAGGRLVGYVISQDRGPSWQFPYRFVPHAATCPELKRREALAAEAAKPEPDTPMF